MAKKPRKQITYKIKRSKSDWALAKLIGDQIGIWLADSYEQYEKEKEDERTSPGYIGIDHENEQLSRFFDLIYHFVDDIPATKFSFSVDGRYYEALQNLAVSNIRIV